MDSNRKETKSYGIGQNKLEPISDFCKREIEGAAYAILPELLAYQGKLFIAAPEKHNKSFALLNMAFSLAGATDLWGTSLFKIPKRHRVGYFDQELGARRLQKRLSGLLGIMPADEIRDAGFFVQPRNRDFRLDRSDGLKMIEDAIKENQIEVALFDPISKFYPSYDENDTRTMGTLVYNLDTLISHTGVSLVFAHHLAKPSQSTRHGAQRMRGSSQLGNDLDTYIELKLLSPHHHKNQLMEAAFVTRDEPIPPVYVKRMENGLIEFVSWENPMNKARKGNTWQGEQDGYAQVNTR